MEFGCPLCNGLMAFSQPCSFCGCGMEDSGMLEDYYGPYSHYGNIELYNPDDALENTGINVCVHLFVCPECGFDKRVSFPEVRL
ncbi:hypothetical protein [Phosphitispora sp. TUW77]|uniref:hypothetical protein n=1 Tax=Phosphitispora sp. TUW77 TaxID=3152361 RepID=UPI003AB22CFD